MRGSLLLLFLLAAVVTARADAILYVTQSQGNRIDGYCLRSDGSIPPDPVVSVPTAGAQPRRAIVGNGALYVAERDRIEAFRILPGGGLELLGATETQVDQDPRDLALAPEGTAPTLYVPQNGGGKLKRILAYPLAADGSLPSDPNAFTCIQGTTNDLYSQFIASALPGGGGLLYVASDPPFINSAVVKMFRFTADGKFNTKYDGSGHAPIYLDCLGRQGGDRPAPTTPVDRRSVPDGARSIQLSADGAILYTEQEFARQIVTFGLDPTTGLFTTSDKLRNRGTCSRSGKKCTKTCPDYAQTCQQGGTCSGDDTTCTDDSQCPALPQTCDKDFKPKKPTSFTDPTRPYRTILLQNDTVLGTVWNGQIDAFGLTSDGRIKTQPTTSSKQDVRTSPTRMIVYEGILYVASGLRNQVQAFTLGKSGTPTSGVPFSTSPAVVNSFPNDVAIAVLTGSCS